MLVERIKAGRGDKMLIFADAACTLAENGEFDECMLLERWWQKAHDEWSGSRRNITVISPTLAQSLIIVQRTVSGRSTA